MAEKLKKKRTENWTQDDRNLLQELVKESVDIVENKNTDTNTNNKKMKAWQNIEESFNLMSNIKRNASQIKQQWCIIKMNAKKQNSAQRKEVMKTGGGVALVQNNPDSNDVRAWLPQEFATDFNEFDGDKSLNQNAANDEISAVVLPMNNAQIKSLITTTENSNSMLDSQTSVADVCTNGNYKRKRGQNNAESSSSKMANVSIKEISEREKKCRLELHQLQVEVEKTKLELYRLQIESEHKKRENLDIQQKLLLQKMNVFIKQSEIHKI